MRFFFFFLLVVCLFVCVVVVVFVFCFGFFLLLLLFYQTEYALCDSGHNEHFLVLHLNLSRMSVCSFCLLVFVGLTGSFSWLAGTEVILRNSELLGGFRES